MPINRELVEQYITIHEQTSSRIYYERNLPKIGVGFNLNWPGAAKILSAVCNADFLPLRAGTTHLKPEQIDKLFSFCVDVALIHAESLFPYFGTYGDNVQVVLADLIYDISYNGLRRFRQFNASVANYRYDVAAHALSRTPYFNTSRMRALDNIKLLQEAQATEGAQPVKAKVIPFRRPTRQAQFRKEGLKRAA